MVNRNDRVLNFWGLGSIPSWTKFFWTYFTYLSNSIIKNVREYQRVLFAVFADFSHLCAAKIFQIRIFWAKWNRLTWIWKIIHFHKWGTIWTILGQFGTWCGPKRELDFGPSSVWRRLKSGCRPRNSSRIFFIGYCKFRWCPNIKQQLQQILHLVLKWNFKFFGGIPNIRQKKQFKKVLQFYWKAVSFLSLVLF